MGTAHEDFGKDKPTGSVLIKNTTYAQTCRDSTPEKGFLTEEGAVFADKRPRFEVHHLVCEV